MSEQTLKNQREDKKHLKRFLVLFVVCLAVGTVAGIFCGIMAAEETTLSVGEMLLGVLEKISPYANLVISTLVLVVCAVVFPKCRARFMDCREEDEETLNWIDIRLSYLMWMISMNMILCYFFMGAGIFCTFRSDMPKGKMLFYLVLTVTGIFYTLIVDTVYQKKIVDLEKEINPEKQGSVYDTRFQKVWFASCDEAERISIYKCAFMAYRVTGTSCIVLFLFCLFGIFLFDFGLMPLTMVLLIWGILNSTYFYCAIRMAKHPEKYLNM